MDSIEMGLTIGGGNIDKESFELFNVDVYEVEGGAHDTSSDRS